MLKYYTCVMAFIALSWSGFAYAVPEVSVRSSRHEDFTRLVFEAQDEFFIKETSVVRQNNRLLIRFPVAPDIKTKGLSASDGVLKDKTFEIILKEPFKFKVLRLSAPPRLSIDIVRQGKEEPAGPATGSSVTGKSPGAMVVLDAGHGGYDTGIISGDSREKELALSVARQVEVELLKLKKPVFLTRKADQFIQIADRAAAANRKAPDIFISFHLSAGDSFVIYVPAAEAAVSAGTETGAYNLLDRQRQYTGKSRSLAEGMAKALKDEFKIEVVMRDMRLPLLNSIAAPAVMMEIPAIVANEKASRTRLSDAVIKGIVYAGR